MMSIDLTEFNKLKKMLDDAGIPYEEFTCPYFKEMEHHQLVYPCDGELRKSDIVIGFGTYGSEQGLLEQMGLLDESALDDDVQGWLYAEEVFDRWSKDYFKN